MAKNCKNRSGDFKKIHITTDDIKIDPFVNNLELFNMSGYDFLTFDNGGIFSQTLSVETGTYSYKKEASFSTNIAIDLTKFQRSRVVAIVETWNDEIYLMGGTKRCDFNVELTYEQGRGGFSGYRIRIDTQEIDVVSINLLQ